MAILQETKVIQGFLAEEVCDFLCRYEQCPKYYRWYESDWVINLILNS